MAKFPKPKNAKSSRRGRTFKQGGNKNAFKNRKEKRKQDRKEKKAKRHSYYINKSKSKDEKQQIGPQINRKKTAGEKIFRDDKNVFNARTEQMKKPRIMPRKMEEENNPVTGNKEQKKKTNRKRKKLTSGDIRKLQLKEANQEEDMNIKRLEKQLKLNKRRKKNTLPKSFTEDGLGYVLEVLDRPEALRADGHLSDADSELSDDIAKAIGRDVNSDDQSDQSDQSEDGVDSFFETGEPSKILNKKDRNPNRSNVSQETEMKHRTDSELNDRIEKAIGRDVNSDDQSDQSNQSEDGVDSFFETSEYMKILDKKDRNPNHLIITQDTVSEELEDYSDSGSSEVEKHLAKEKDCILMSKNSRFSSKCKNRGESQVKTEDSETCSDSDSSEIDELVALKKESGTLRKNVSVKLKRGNKAKSEDLEIHLHDSEEKNSGKFSKKRKDSNFEEVSAKKKHWLALSRKKEKDQEKGSELEMCSDSEGDVTFAKEKNSSVSAEKRVSFCNATRIYEAAKDIESDVSDSESEGSDSKDRAENSESDNDSVDIQDKSNKFCSDHSNKLHNRDRSSVMDSKMSEKPGNQQAPCIDATKLKRADENRDSGDVTGKRSRSNSVDSMEEQGELWEDIYGRLRDKEGNVVVSGKGSAGGGGKYVPPAKREQEGEEKKSFQLQRLKRQLKGLLNRLSEANVQRIANQIENLYMHHSRSDMNQTLVLLVLESVVSRSLTPERLVMEHALLIALLHANVGTEIGAYFLQSLVDKLDSFLKSGGNYGEGKECDNLLLLILHLYTFKMTEHVLIFDIMKQFIDQFQEKDIELILLMLRSVGFPLRKDNPLKLKEMIVALQSKASTSQHDQTRIRFMLETMMAIRNNNMHKIPNYDPSLAEHLRKALRGFIRKGCYVQELCISLDDLLNSEERGRWWIVGSAWSGKTDQQEKEENKISTQLSTSNVSEKILDLASKQRMNTDIRKTIFCLIMSAEDYMDAFEKVLHLNLKNQQEREIIHVALDCCLQEKRFNRFYALLLQKLCQFDRRFQMTLQFSLWDKFKDLENLQTWQVTNMAQLLIQLLTNDALPLSVLKAIHLAEMDRPLVKFLRQVMLGLLLHESEEVCRKVFGRIAPAPKLQMLREGLRLFMRHFLLRNRDKMDPEVADKLADRVEMADAALLSVEKKLRL